MTNRWRHFQHRCSRDGKLVLFKYFARFLKPRQITIYFSNQILALYLFTYPVCVSVIHPFEGRFEKTVPETEGRGGKLVENGGIAPVVIPLVVAITFE